MLPPHSFDSYESNSIIGSTDRQIVMLLLLLPLLLMVMLVMLMMVRSLTLWSALRADWIESADRPIP